jgi:plasmid stabilization system protein ParE
VMARPVEVHPEAISEAQAAYRWYVDRNNAAAEAFLAELDRAVELISESYAMADSSSRHQTFSIT